MNQDSRSKYLRESIISFPLAKAIWRAYELEKISQISLLDPILDMGCGNGVFSKILFQNKSKKVIGLDISAYQLRVAKKQKIYHKLIQGDICHLKISPGSFNTVLANCTLEHIKNIDLALNQISNVLCRSGIFIFSVPSQYFNQNMLGANCKKYVSLINLIFQHYHLYSPKIWQQKLFRHRLKLIKHEFYMPKNLQRFWELSLTYSILPHIMGLIFFRWPYPLQRLLVTYIAKIIKKYNQNNKKRGGGLILVAKKV